MTDRTNPSPFRRQVNFRIAADDWPLVEAVARQHGGIQAGLLAALRAYAAQRLESASVPPPPQVVEIGRQTGPAASPESEKPRTPPGEPRESARRRAARTAVARETVELNVAEAALVLGLSPESLRAAIRRGTRPGCRNEQGRYLAELSAAQLRASGVKLTPRGAAEVLGLRPATIKRRCKERKYPNARHDGGGWRIPASDLF